ncbi:ABC transporter permease [Dietzia aurantiaca]|uniref:ABC transporter permease n=1 Tax=Dietzia aurantiaca TaxID=983873 RepID=UPI001E3A590A|nr:ABC transporter permease [Dietzia aurantiaca]MCD2261294.1 ABC transporter permease [Dietzia aurantiaca]
MNVTYWAIDLRRTLRDITNIFFIVGLPLVMYFVFGSAQSYRDAPVAHGNVGAVVMISMAVYGAVTATTAISGGAALERFQGWGRQLGLTPWSGAGFVVTKSAVAMTIAAVPVLTVGIAGAATGAQATPLAWVLSLGAAWLGSAVFAGYGLSAGMAFRSESALGVAGGSLVLLAFAGNLFIPLSGVMLDLARFTPLYGVNALARYPITGGVVADGVVDPVWLPVLNVVAWALILGTTAAVLVRRRRGRV